MSASSDIIPKKGTTVYSRHGHQAYYVGYLEQQKIHVVEVILRAIDGAGDECDVSGPTETWSEVFTSAPKEVVEKELVALQAKVSEAQSALYKVREENRLMDKEIEARKARLKQHEALKYLDDYIAGRITHYVVADHYGEKGSNWRIIDVKTPDNASGNLDQWERKGWLPRDGKTKLLSLFGASGGQLDWQLNHYSDGSGITRTTAYPCLSLHEAVSKVDSLTQVVINAWRAAATPKEKEAIHYLGDLVKSRKAAGLPVPQDVIDELCIREVTRKETAVAAAEKALEAARQELQKAVFSS